MFFWLNKKYIEEKLAPYDLERRSRYNKMGYQAFLKHYKRDFGDDLAVSHRKEFREGWDEASRQNWTKMARMSIPEDRACDPGMNYGCPDDNEKTSLLTSKRPRM